MGKLYISKYNATPRPAASAPVLVLQRNTAEAETKTSSLISPSVSSV